jgi:hypothetical protein
VATGSGNLEQAIACPRSDKFEIFLGCSQILLDDSQGLVNKYAVAENNDRILLKQLMAMGEIPEAREVSVLSVDEDQVEFFVACGIVVDRSSNVFGFLTSNP